MPSSVPGVTRGLGEGRGATGSACAPLPSAAPAPAPRPAVWEVPDPAETHRVRRTGPGSHPRSPTAAAPGAWGEGGASAVSVDSGAACACALTEPWRAGAVIPINRWGAGAPGVRYPGQGRTGSKRQTPDPN